MSDPIENGPKAVHPDQPVSERPSKGRNKRRRRRKGQKYQGNKSPDQVAENQTTLNQEAGSSQAQPQPQPHHKPQNNTQNKPQNNTDNKPQNKTADDNQTLASTPRNRHGHPARRRKPIYSAIDLGTNNCRLLIAKPTEHGFRVIDAFSRIVRLGEGLEASGKLSDAAMDRTIDALKICAEKLARRGVTTMHHVATEACRAASNGAEFIERVRRETGINIDVISTADEARLAVMGCQSLIAPGNRNALVFDIGGGSTELIWVRISRSGRSEIQGWTSIPWGVVNLTEKFASGDGMAVTPNFDVMVDTVSTHLHEFEAAYTISDIVKNSKVQFLGTSGTVTTLASLHLELPRYDRSKVDGAWMKAVDIRRLSNEVASMTYMERAAQPCIGEERADLVVAGCAIIESLLGMWPVDNLRIADRGIREGILRNLMQRDKEPRQNWRKPQHRNDRPSQN